MLADRMISPQLKTLYSGSAGKLITKGVAVALLELAGAKKKSFEFSWEDDQGLDKPSLWSVRGRVILLIDYLVGLSKDPKFRAKEGFGKKLWDRLGLPDIKMVIPEKITILGNCISLDAGKMRQLLEQWTQGALCDQNQVVPVSHGRGAENGLEQGDADSETSDLLFPSLA